VEQVPESTPGFGGADAADHHLIPPKTNVDKGASVSLGRGPGPWTRQAPVPAADNSVKPGGGGKRPGVQAGNQGPGEGDETGGTGRIGNNFVTISNYKIVTIRANSVSFKGTKCQLCR
jgi:hypothetical protein